MKVKEESEKVSLKLNFRKLRFCKEIQPVHPKGNQY